MAAWIAPSEKAETGKQNTGLLRTIMDQTLAVGRSLPPFALIPATAAFAVVIALVAWKAPTRATRFVVFAVWLRYILSAFHTFTFAASPLGLSWNALGSLAICAVGLLIIRSRKIFDVGLSPFYVMLAALLASAAVNDNMAGTADTIVKFIYLAVVVLATVDAIEDMGADSFFKFMLWPFIVPFGLQAISVMLGAAKATESDGSASYIGGFNHEAAFSVALATGLLVVCLGRRFGAAMKLLLLLLCGAGIVLANYRTAILAMSPLVVATLMHGVVRRFVPQQRPFIAGAMGVVGALIILIGAIAGAERFADIGTAYEQRTELIKPQDQFTSEDRRLLSGRPFIWSGYLLGYADAKPIQHAFGLGVNSWQGTFSTYAHNTLISALYEIGAFGVFATLFLWTWMIVLAARVTDGSRLLLLAAHASFFILNMATMPLWMIEGVIFYGVLCGATVASFTASERRRKAERRRQEEAEARSHFGAAITAS
ncbi:O-antigen ligase family protein [Caulobacter hibisci]|uniref:O-antigen ligase family protein n=1 Tax=Caulobacter hibisci TaxID=2035993 RepID=A0ABS0T422_9CAUL|nr:O-antigen ligase family protein [Caulobacter hibisci]MBI1686414.1 O-antigen ligase family protein [Caulobacter hibisci]